MTINQPDMLPGVGTEGYVLEYGDAQQLLERTKQEDGHVSVGMRCRNHGPEPEICAVYF